MYNLTNCDKAVCLMRLRELIEESGKTQKQIADDLGWPRRTLNNYVCEVREPDYVSLGRICDYFGCTTDYMLGRSESRFPAISDEDAGLLDIYHALPLEIRRAVDGLMAPYRQAAEQKTGS